MQLLPHAGQLRGGVLSFALKAERRSDGALALNYQLDADLDLLLLPPPRDPVRAEGLWHHTCFEAFVAVAGSRAYCELNFSPSGEWAAYAFTGYRAGRAVPELSTPPGAHWRRTAGRLELAVVVNAGVLLPDSGPLRLAASAILEDRSGTIAYWALRHPEVTPDFHHPESFVWELP